METRKWIEERISIPLLATKIIDTATLRFKLIKTSVKLQVGLRIYYQLALPVDTQWQINKYIVLPLHIL